MNDSNRPTGEQRDPAQPLSPLDDRSPPDLDEAILRASRRAVRFHGVIVFLEKWHISFLARPEFLAGLIAGALACAAIHVLFAKPPDAASPGMAHLADPASSGAQAETADPASRQTWLGRIADMVRDGNVPEAQAQLRAFQVRYPDGERATAR